MAFVDKLLVVGHSAIGLIGGKVEVRIVSPRIVAVKLLDRHQFNSVNAEALDIVETCSSGFDGLLVGEVANQEFVNHQVVAVSTVKVLHLPAVGIGRLKHCNWESAELRRVFLEVRINRLGNPFVAPWVENHGCVRVGHIEHIVNHKEVSVALAEVEAFDGGVEETVALIVHQLGICRLVSIPFAQKHHVLLSWSKEAESNRAVSVYGSALLQGT